MKHSKALKILLFLLVSYTTSFSQSLDNFNDVLNAKRINKLFTKKIGKDISQRTYLGTITDSKGRIKYYVVKEFLRVQAAIVFHGHSRILFFDKHQKLANEYVLSTPDELPFKLKQNSLYFRYLNNELEKINIVNVMDLPSMICVEPQKNCYDVSTP